MALHTPGPWRVITGTKVAAEKPKRHGGGKSICAVRPSSWSAEAISEARANARLIAAAPDLLAAVKALIPHARGETAFLRAAVIEAAEAAVAKAEGR